jgi:signal transduction histidine kinase
MPREPYFGSDRRQGTGLGLPISSQLAELMGGSLEIANGDAGGAIARLRLPLEYEQGEDERD